ncbi:MAG: D-alanyl-D-alanine carboxypeptidase/D-alanyl-D-alanine-endopeptidase [Terriglobia bacterium]|jgi:D-alanyl-D-alanine carboxypeptidase/D-alanyl-D-alanine-endopeptidase (penicillin-binding protein 4)
MSKRHLLSVVGYLVSLSLPSPVLQAQGDLTERIQAVMSGPEFAHAHFGVEISSLDTGKRIYALNENKFFVPGSTTKLLTEGTALELLGQDYRFHTRVYWTGKLNSKGLLDGDIVLVASGDPNLSGRIQPDGTLAFEDGDHSYGGPDSKGLSGDPLLVVGQFADQIAAKGIRKVKGRVLIDATLFPEGTRELGTGVVVSPIVVNDNVIDVLASPGATEGAPVKLQIRPETAYLQFENHATTGKAGVKPEINYDDGTLRPDGTRTVTVTGTLPLGKPPAMHSYAVPEPARFASVALTEALRKRNIQIAHIDPPPPVDIKRLAANYNDAHLLAEHISPPLGEEVKVTLKVSQNLHASMTPFTLGAILAHASKDIDQAGFDREHAFLEKAGLDLSGAAQGDGAGGDAFFTPDFMVHYLTYMSTRPSFPVFRLALPVLGRDGTLVKIQTASPAAGHVFAKTGTLVGYDALNKKLMVTGKGLAGYIDTAAGQHLVFAAYVNMVEVSSDNPDALNEVPGEALGKIAAAAYDSPLGQ